MNTAKPSPTQEVVAGQPPSVEVAESARQYGWRLLKAAMLVFVGVTANLWIDGLPPLGRSKAPLVSDTAADSLVASPDLPAGQSTVLRAPEGTGVPSSFPAESARPVATAGTFADHVEPRRVRIAELPDRPTYRRIATAPSPAGDILRTGGLPDVPEAELPALPTARRFSGWTGEAVALSPVVVPGPSAPETPSSDAGAATPSPTPASSSSRVARALLVAPRRDEESILLVLHEYESAVGRKDPAAAKAVWPALDDRALARAFNDLQSHSLALEDCGVTVANSNAAARARCQGVATYLPKVGRRKPISASHEWTFNLSKTGGDWQIESAAIR
jgi:hypothetical protein